RGRVGGAHEDADLHRGGADAPGDRGRDGKRAQLDAQSVEHRLIVLDGGLERIRLRLGVVEIGDRRRALGDEFGVAAYVAFGAFELRPVARQIAFSLAYLRL